MSEFSEQDFLSTIQTRFGIIQPSLYKPEKLQSLESLLRSREFLARGSRALTGLNYNLADQGRKEYLQLDPLNQGTQPNTEQVLTGYSGLSPTVRYFDPFAGAFYAQNATSDIPLEDLPFTYAKEDNITYTSYGAGSSWFNQEFAWKPDSTRFIYKIVINLPLVLNVTAFTSGTYGINSFSMTIKNSVTLQDVMTPITVNVPTYTLTAVGTKILIVRGSLSYPDIKLQKILFGQKLLINFNVVAQQGVGTGFFGAAAMFPDQISNNTKKFYPACIGIHSFTGIDHLENLINDPVIQDRLNYGGLAIDPR